MPQPVGPSSPEPPSLQFSLRTMLATTAIVSVLFAVYGLLSFAAWLLLVLFVAMVGLHVAATAIGLQLRNHSSSQSDGRQRAAESPVGAKTGSRSHLPARMRERTSLRRTWLAATILGPSIGGAAGLVLFQRLQVNGAGLLVGGLSVALLGALAGLLIGSFLTTALHAWHEAAHDPDAHLSRSDRRMQ